MTPRNRYYEAAEASMTVLDRLLEQPLLPGEMVTYDVASARECIGRDLEVLLNTRRQEDLVPLEYEEAARSILNFGLPETTRLGNLISASQQSRLCRSLEEAIRIFEPRLHSVSVRPIEPGKNKTGMHFRLEAIIKSLSECESWELGFMRDTGMMSVSSGRALMNDELLPYYERELIFIRKIANEFANQYPERAAALKLSRDGCDDPHVERIIEAFALVAGRIQHKLDEEFPEITGSLLELLYPHLLRPVPPMAVLQFEVDPLLSRQREGQLIPRGTIVYAAPQKGVQCRFRTAYPSYLWPIKIASATFGSSSDVIGGGGGGFSRHALRLELQLLGEAKLTDLDLKTLRFRIGGDAQAAHWLYELLFNKVKRIVLRPLDGGGSPGGVEGIGLGPGAIQQVGFGREEALLPVVETSFQGYRLMQEYFCYPQKFLFFDLAGLEQLPRPALSARFEIVIYVEALEQNDRAILLESAVNAETFQLGCTPAINLFEHTAEPIRLSHTKTAYQVVPDVYSPGGLEVYSVDRVISVQPHTSETKTYRPFYSFEHGTYGTSERVPEAFWFSSRRRSMRSGDGGTDVYLSLVDQNFKLSEAPAEAITVNVTCSNRDLVAELNFSDAWGELDLEAGAMTRTRIVHGPTATLRPAARGGAQWRLISHLSLNHLSLVEGGADALREMLRLYDPLSNHTTSRQIDGLTAIRSNRKIARLDSEFGFVFCQGIAIDAEFDEDRFSGGGAFLMASVLERFFGLYCGINSFTQLRASTTRRKGVVWQWPIRSGEQAVA